MKTSELRQAIKDLNLSGLVSLDFNRGYNDENKNYHVVVGDQRLSFETQKEQYKVYNLLTRKFGFECWSDVHPYVSEQERGWADGVAADCANPKLHGHTVAVCLSGDGNGFHRVWDWNLQKTVNIEDLSPAPVISENK